ncbi:MAG: hypothetical protein ACFFGP_05900 [Promethearchaeota archaeon]
MKKNVSKVLLSLLTLIMVFTLVSSVNVLGFEGPDQIIDVQGDSIQIQLQSNNRTMFCFRERTRLTICTNTDLELEINCEALRIGEKDVIIEIEGDTKHRMTMTCTREETQLGLMNGSLHRVRNRNMYRYLEGFCISMECSPSCNCNCKCDPECSCECECQCQCDPDCICPCECECNCELECNCICNCKCQCDPVCICECNCQCNCDPECKCDSECPYNGNFLKARLRIRATNQNRLGQWACYVDETNEWVTSPTINEDGYLTTEITTLSTWTLLIPETIPIESTITIASISIVGIIAILSIFLKKRFSR